MGRHHETRGEARASAAARRQALAYAETGGEVVTPRLRRLQPTPLTRREREVAELAADGLGNRDIADRLHLSVRTIESHLQRAYAKLGVGSRRGLSAALTPTRH